MNADLDGDDDSTPVEDHNALRGTLSLSLLLSNLELSDTQSL